MRISNLVNLSEGLYVNFQAAAGFSRSATATGIIGLVNGGDIDISLLKPNKIYNIHLRYAYCTNDILMVYNSKVPVIEILALSNEFAGQILTEDELNFLVTEYES